MKKALTAAGFGFLAITQTAYAHGTLTSHAHPHADWSSTIAFLLAGGAFVALFLIPLSATAKARTKTGNKH